MKNLLVVTALLFSLGCNTATDKRSEEAAITKLLENESHFAAKGDTTQWAGCRLNSEEAFFTYTNAEYLRAGRYICWLYGSARPCRLHAIF